MVLSETSSGVYSFVLTNLELLLLGNLLTLGENGSFSVASFFSSFTDYLSVIKTFPLS